MNNDVIYRFYNDRNNQIQSNIMYKFVQYINEGYSFDKIIIVEGSTDEYFYSNIRNLNLNNNVKYLFNFKNNKDKGKDAVINSYYMISKNDKTNRFLDKCIFIVDHDYDGVKSMHYDVYDDQAKYFTITKPYSFENYFLELNNLCELFKYFKLTNEDVEKFRKQYSKFAEEIQEYTRLKSTTIGLKKKQTSCYDRNCLSYSPKYKYDDIFNFKFINNECTYNRNNLCEEISRMKQYINNNNNAINYYKNHSINLVKNYDFIRGHDAFNFLTKYLHDIYGINFSDYPPNNIYNNVVKNFQVDIVIKNGLGQIINSE